MNQKEPQSYVELIGKLDRFTRKYYLNKIIRGSLLFVGLILFLFIIFSVLESQFYFTKGIRKGLFFGFIGIALLSLGGWILRPLLSYFKLGKSINHEQAAAIIGRHFTDVKDKLLNVLQLRDQLAQNTDTTLLMASIDQKTAGIKPVPFQRAIDLSKNRKYLKYALPPVLLLGGLLLMAPSIISEGSSRIIKNNEEFEKPAPFRFTVKHANDFRAIQFSDVEILVDTEGDFVPEKAFIELGEHTYQLDKAQKHDFKFVIKNVKEDLSFVLKSGEVSSKAYDIDVLQKPQFTNMAVRAIYPKYIGRASETFENNGDLTVPLGTQLQWTIDAKQTADIHIKFNRSNEQDLIAFDKKAKTFSYRKGVRGNTPYTLYASSSELPLADSMQYTIESIPDQHPTIVVQSVEDSLNTDFRLFTGKADDDYGLKNLYVVSRIMSEDGVEKGQSKKTIKPVSGLYTTFDYLFTVDSFDLADGDELFYHFEIWDNDGIHGSKVAKSSVYSYKKASLEELEEQTEENNEDIKEALKENLEKTQELKKEIKDLREKFLNKKELNWQDKKDAEKLLQKQEEIREALERAKQMMEENKQNQEKLSDMPDNLQEKQEKLEELMDKVMDDELKKLMDDINKMLEEMQRDESIEQMQEMEMNSQEMELEMDKLLELFKQLEVEQQLQQEIDKLNELAEKQEKLGEESEQGDKSEEELKKEQEKLSDEFEDVKDKLDELKEKNKELENPKDIEETEELEKEIDKDQQDSEDALDKEQQEDKQQEGDNEDGEQEENDDSEPSEQGDQEQQESQKQKASKSQKSAGQKMKKMAEQLQAGMQGGEMSQMGEDIETMRQLLENILTLSFDEEGLIGSFQRTDKTTTKYVELVQDQFKLQDDFSLVRDSLHALSKRNTQIESYVMDKVADIDLNFDKSLTQFEEREKAKAMTSQQFVMTYLNDLAVMLSESMQQMQQQMSSMMPGSQMCNKPKPGQGGGKKPMDKITEGQQGIKDGLQKMMEGMKEGGEKPSSEEFGKMAQQQAAMRKMLRDLQKQNSERGQNDRMLQEIMDAMDAMEKDLVNKNLTNEMLKRQQEIETRLLEAEKAERQRDLDDKRESKTAEKIQRTIPPAIEAYLREREKQVREVDRTSPLLTPYYKRLVDLYYKSLNN